MTDDKNAERAKKRALNALNYRALSHGEMRERLVRLGESEETAEETADYLAEIGLLDDLEYARGLVSGLTRRGYGKQRILNEFYKRRIPRDIWEEALETLSEFTNEGEAPDAAVSFIAKKLGGTLPEWEDRRRIGSALTRRGFSWDEINSAFKQYIETAEEDE